MMKKIVDVISDKMSEVKNERKKNKANTLQSPAVVKTIRPKD